MSRNYTVPNVSRAWPESRNTHAAVSTAIWAISGGERTPAAIWDAPTSAEFDHVKMAVQEYLAHGDFAPDPDNLYAWGVTNIMVENPRWDD